LLSLFRTNQTANSVYFFFYIILLRGVVVIWPELFAWQPAHAGYLSERVYDWVGTSGWLPELLAAVLLFVQAVYITLLTTKHRLGSEVSLFAGLFYIILASATTVFWHLTPALMATTFFIVALDEILSTYQQKSCADRIFNAGFWTAVASLFAPPYAVLLIFVLIALLVLRAPRLREFMMVLIGFAVPYFLLSTYFYWYDQLPVFWQEDVWNKLAWLDFSTLNPYDLVELSFFGLLVLWMIFSRSTILIGALMRTRVKTDIVYWALLLCGLPVLVSPSVSTDDLFVLVVPLGILLGLRFLVLPKRAAAVLHFLLIVAILIWQLKPLWLSVI